MNDTGVAFNNKIYIVDDKYPEVYYEQSNTWSNWTAPLIKFGRGACLVTWKSTFLLFGGDRNRLGIQRYNHSTHSWSKVNTSSAPFDMYFSGCVVLPNENVLIAGSHNNYTRKSALFNLKSNKWTLLNQTINIDRSASTLVRLGERVFAIGGHNTTGIEEFHIKNLTW